MKRKWLIITLLIITLCGFAFGIVKYNYCKDVEAIAHRGYGIFNKNTKSAFKLSQGFNAAECDIWFTKDNEMVVSHYNIVKSQGKEYEISSNEYEFLKSKNDNILIIDDYLQIIKEKDLKAVIDIKSYGVSEENVNSLVKKVEKFNLSGNIIIISYEKAVALKFKEMTDYEVQYIFSDNKEGNIEFCVKNNINACVKASVVDSWLVEEMHKNNLQVNVWTVNEIFSYLYFASLGVDYITSDWIR